MGWIQSGFREAGVIDIIYKSGFLWEDSIRRKDKKVLY